MAVREVTGRREQRRRRHVGIGLVLVIGFGLIGGVGAARAVDPTSTRSNCVYADADEQARNIQTCTVYSQSMESDVVIKVRPSDQEPGSDEQGIYFVGGSVTPGEALTDGYSSKYNLVAILGSVNAYSADWESTPLDASGNPVKNYSGGTYRPRWETFMTTELPDYLKENFDVSTSDNAIVGLSEAGGQVVNIALQHPQVFSVALSISGYYHTDNPLGWLIIPGVLQSFSGVYNGFDGMWGNPLLPGNTWAVNDVSLNIGKAKTNNQTIIIASGNGIPSSWAELSALYQAGGVSNVIGSMALEALSELSAVLIKIVARAFDLPVDVVIDSGAHSWTHWGGDLSEYAQLVEKGLTKYQVPQATPVLAALKTTVTAAAETGSPSTTKQTPSVTVESSAAPTTDDTPAATSAPTTTPALSTPPTASPGTTTTSASAAATSTSASAPGSATTSAGSTTGAGESAEQRRPPSTGTASGPPAGVTNGAAVPVAGG